MGFRKKYVGRMFQKLPVGELEVLGCEVRRQALK